ncbi:hypothetical protein ACH4SP_25980 [Streptomyces sp. NPDC021093]|uniref:hypothetical protein n=1 Tax=Streptomyces sp. NPDC021093 TaxID=3365112 RepID=UPI0037951274
MGNSARAHTSGRGAVLRWTGPVLAGALALVTVLPANAHAASGQFTYIRGDNGAPAVLFNPPNDVCLPLDGGAAHAGNDTDATAFVYADGACTPEQGLAIVGVGATWDQTNPPPLPARSVRFGSTG